MATIWNRKTSIERLTWYKYLNKHGIFHEWMYTKYKSENRLIWQIK
jgi:hypothetical protein